MPLAPYNRRELFLEAIRTRDTSALPDPNNREELFLKDIADQVAAIPAGIPVSVPAELSELLANLPEPHTHTERFYNDIIGALLVAITVTDTTPYITRVTAGGLPVTGTAELKKKLGNTVAVNQLVHNGNFEDTSYWSASDSSLSVSDNIGTFTATAQNGYIRNSFSTVNGHKYIAFATVKILSGKASFEVYNIKAQTTSIGSFETLSLIYEASSTGTAYYPRIYDLRESGWDAVSVKNVFIIDLTLWFGSNDNIPSDLLSHPENWGRYYAGSLDYAAGYLDSADGTVMRSIGRNVWDEEWEVGGINATTGADDSNTDRIRSKNYIPVIPNTEYYGRISSGSLLIYWYDRDKNYIERVNITNTNETSPSNAFFCRFHTYNYGATYLNDITISLYYSGESGYDQYYPYSALAEVDTGSEVLRSAGAVADEKTPDGTITRKVGYVDMGTLNWFEISSGLYSAENIGIKYSTVQSVASNLICGKYVNLSYSEFAGGGSPDKAIATYFSSDRLYARDTSYAAVAAFKTAMSGIYLYYELATLTTEQGTDFNPGYAVEAGGTESWLQDQSTGVPQGHETEYKEFTT